MNYFIYILIITLLFLIYVELSVGGIVYRVNASGKKNIQFGNIIHYLVDPLHNKFLWNPSLLDVNYVFVFLVSSLLYRNVCDIP